jgi:hypothetical protein
MNMEMPHVNRSEGEEFADGEFKGLLVKKDANRTSIIELDSQYCCDADRWEVMPSVEPFPDLVRLDLHKSRYIKVVHASVAELPKLQHLGLTRCTRLQELPPTIGQLQNLQVVSNTVRSLDRVVTGLPEPLYDGDYVALLAKLFPMYLLSLQLDLSDSENIAHLPESIGELKR